MTQYLFSPELFSNTTLNQVNQFAQATKSTILNLIMQNKPNLRNDQMNITPYSARRYGNLPLHGGGQNKPNQTQFKANSDLSATLQSQNKPNSNPIPPTHSCYESTTLRQPQTQQSITNNRLSFELAAHSQPADGRTEYFYRKSLFHTPKITTISDSLLSEFRERTG
jgi:hypothetical protein